MVAPAAAVVVVVAVVVAWGLAMVFWVVAVAAAVVVAAAVRGGVSDVYNANRKRVLFFRFIKSVKRSQCLGTYISCYVLRT